MSDKPTGKGKPLPPLKTDEDAERFVDTADLSEYDLSGGQMVQFEFERKTTQVNVRMPDGLVQAIKAKAKARGIPYQRYIREALEKSLR